MLLKLIKFSLCFICAHILAAKTCATDWNGPPSFCGSRQSLPAALFLLLDSEADPMLQRHVRDTITGLLTSLAEQQLSAWLVLFKEVLTTSADTTGGSSQPTPQGDNGSDRKKGALEAGEGDADDDAEEFHASGEEAVVSPSGRPVGLPPPRWPTRVFAAQLAGKLLLLLRESNTTEHFDLALARQMRSHSSTYYLVLHLSDLIRLAFIAATSDCDALRMEGLHLLQLLIDCFAAQQEPEFPGHSILEQYQAQVFLVAKFPFIIIKKLK